MTTKSPPPVTGSEDWDKPGVSGIYEGDPNPLRKKGAPVVRIYYRNHEITCPECKRMIRTMPISITRAAFGVKVGCEACGHNFIYSYREG